MTVSVVSTIRLLRMIDRPIVYIVYENLRTLHNNNGSNQEELIAVKTCGINHSVENKMQTNYRVDLQLLLRFNLITGKPTHFEPNFTCKRYSVESPLKFKALTNLYLTCSMLISCFYLDQNLATQDISLLAKVIVYLREDYNLR